MRWFLVWLLAGWIAGVASGVVDLEGSAVVLVWLALLYWGWQYRLSYPVLVVGSTLVGVGYLHGGLAGAQLEGTACVHGDGDVEVLVERIFRQEEDRTQYVVTTEDGCTLLVTTPVWPRYRVGDRWIVRGKMESVSALPEELQGYGEYLRRDGIGATMLYPHVEVVEKGSGWQWQIRESIRVRQNRVLREPEASVVRAMVWGERGAAGENYEEQLTAAGVRHVLAISGLHVSIVVGGLMIIGRWARLPNWAEVVALLMVLWGYVWLVGMPVSAVRAGWFWTVFLVGWRGQMFVSWLTALFVTVGVMVSIRPIMLLDVGLQLSVAAVCGIALATRVFQWEWKSRGGVGGGMLAGLAGGAGAMLATGPITSVVFGEMSWAGLVVNLLVLPVVPMIIGGSLVSLLAGLIWEPLGLLVGLGVRGVWWYVEVVTAGAAAIPGAYVEEVEMSGWWLVWWYPLLLIGGLLWLRWRGKTWRVIWE